MAVAEEHGIANDASVRSPTLSQMLLNPKSTRTPFRYPARRRPSRDEDTTEKDFASPVVRQQPPAQMSAPPHRLKFGSGGSKSLGIRRRLKSVENFASPCLGQKRAVSRFAEVHGTDAKKAKLSCNILSNVTKNKQGIETSTRDLNTIANTEAEIDEEPVEKKPSCGSFTDTQSDQRQNPKTCQASSPVGFKTAGLKVKSVPEKTLKTAEKLIAKLQRYSNNNGTNFLKAKGETTGVTGSPLKNIHIQTKHTTRSDIICFVTASNKSIAISQTALAKAKKLIEEVDSEKQIGKNFTNIDTHNAISNDSPNKLDKQVSVRRGIDLISDGENNCDVTDSQNKVVEQDDYFQEPQDESGSSAINFIPGDPENTGNYESNLTCTSPVLQVRRRRKKCKKRKCDRRATVNPPIDENGHSKEVPEQKSPKNEHTADSSFLSDGLDLEILAVDLNEKFEAECEEHQDNPKQGCDSRNNNLKMPLKYCNANTKAVSSVSSDNLRESVLLFGSENNDSHHGMHTVPSSYPLRSYQNDSSLLLGEFLRQKTSRTLTATCVDGELSQHQIHKNQNYDLGGYRKELVTDEMDDELQRRIENTRTDCDSDENREENLDEESMFSDDELLVQAGAEFEKGRMISQNKIQREKITSVTGVMSASEKKIPISNKALDIAKKLLEMLEKKDDEKNTATRPRQGQIKDQISTHSNKETGTDIASTKVMDYQTRTGNNKPAVISDATLVRAEKFISEVTTGNHKPGGAAEKSMHSVNDVTMKCKGFQTASNEPVVTSEAASARAEKFIFEDTNCKPEGATEKNMHPFKKESLVERKFADDITMKCKGFQTARNKPVVISEAANSKPEGPVEGTMSSFKEDPLNNRKCEGFQTASNKPVVISEVAIARAKKIDI